jgi:hypothetical protein
MPIGFGLMLVPPVNLSSTTIVLDSISPSPAYCGDVVTFSVTVTNNTVGGPDPTGDFEIVDQNTNNILATGTLGARGVGIAVATLVFGPVRLFARYLGVSNSFAPSQTSSIRYGLQPENTSINIISPTIGSYYCYAYTQRVTAEVTTGRAVPVTVGSVNFKLYTSNTEYIDLGSEPLDGYGMAVGQIPPYTTLATRSNYLQATYEGFECYNISRTPTGMSGLLVFPTENDPTSIVISVDGGTVFPEEDPIMVVGTVTATNLDNPSDGYVEFLAEDGYVFSLGTAIPINGVASLYVPGNTFTVGGRWMLYAQYFTDGECYATSLQDSIAITPT